MTEDIVAQLWDLPVHYTGAYSVACEAIDEIKRLREENNTFKMKVHELYTEVERLSREVSRG